LHGSFTCVTVRSSQFGSTPNAYAGAQPATGSKERSFLRVTPFQFRIQVRNRKVTLVLVHSPHNCVQKSARNRPFAVDLALVATETSRNQHLVQIRGTRLLALLRNQVL